MKLIDLQEKLSELKCFTPLEAKRFLNLPDTTIQKIIYRYTKKGILIKIRNGLYAFKGRDFPHLWHIANRLYSPSYISFETALSYYGIIPETVYTIISATSKITRNYELQKKEFIYHKIKKNAYTGYKPIKFEGFTVLIAEPEKAIADYLYITFLKKLTIDERFRFKNVKKSLLIKYIERYENEPFIKRAKNVIRKHY